ncbi:hypothetical protein RvY_02478 [Ramazzottius varieornatus]|uniref:G-patch domain-containing protein n=1 Tax=Ramazzottius varieornatus TaxID=947166 RepID=A0A1D1UJU0_RAMVA|nr:hypothetical protein RvY_02478 [Ramazzottius varieornatus]
MATGEDSTTTTGTKMVFSFSKKLESKIKVPSSSSFRSEDVRQGTHQLITSSEDLEHSSTRQPVDDLVIPLIRHNKWTSHSTPSLSTAATSAPQPSLNPEDAAAADAILKEARELKEVDEMVHDMSLTEIPLWMQNRLPQGFETEEKLNVDLRAEESTMEDYEMIPVEKYGLALLRGMGWKPERGIGKTNKVSTKPYEVHMRPRGLGLGATPKNDKKKRDSSEGSSQDKQEEKKTMQVGSFVRIVEGRHENRVGKVVSIDMETDRWSIQTVGEEKRVVTVPGAHLAEISEREYTKAGKYINNDRYHDYKVVADARLLDQVSQVRESDRRRTRDGLNGDDGHEERRRDGDSGSRRSGREQREGKSGKDEDGQRWRRKSRSSSREKKY